MLMKISDHAYSFILRCYPYDVTNHSAQHCEFSESQLSEYNLLFDSPKFVVTDNKS